MVKMKWRKEPEETRWI